MTTYYLDGTNGDDGDDGLTLATAWKTPQYADGQLSNSDILEVLGGNTYTLTGGVSLGVSATVRAYQPNGESKPVFDGNSAGGFNGVTLTAAATLQGIRIINCSGAYSAVYLSPGAGNTVTIEDCEFVDNGVNGINMDTLSPSCTVNVRRCYAKDNGTNGSGDGYGSRGAATMNLYDCYSEGHNAGSGASDGYSSHNTGAMNCYRCVSIDDEDCFHMTGSGTHTILNCIGKNGTAVNSALVRTSGGGGTVVVSGFEGYQRGTNGFVTDDGGLLTVANSLLVVEARDTGSSQGFYSTSDGGNISVVNCAVFDFSTATGTNFRACRAGNALATFTMYNNIMVLSGSHQFVYDTNSIVTSDYNCFYPAAGTNFRLGGSNLTFANWQAAGNDTNGFVADPLCYNVADVLPNLSAARLRKGSPCIGTGLNLFSSGVTTDGVGKTRPSSGAFDLGPVIYKSAMGRARGNMLDNHLETIS